MAPVVALTYTGADPAPPSGFGQNALAGAAGDAHKELIQLPHPGTGVLALYQLQSVPPTPEAAPVADAPRPPSMLLEVIKAAPPTRSWFIGNSVLQDGGIYCITPIDPLFILVPILDKKRDKGAESGKFLSLDDILCDEAVPHLYKLESLADLPRSLTAICDVKETSGYVFYRLNDTKVQDWARLKVAALLEAADDLPLICSFNPKEQYVDGNLALREEYRLATILRLMTSYLSPAFHETLAASYSFPATAKQEAADKENEKTARALISPAEYQARSGAGGAEGGGAKPDDAAKKRKLSSGVKSLAKVNVKGMKSISSFFAKNNP